MIEIVVVSLFITGIVITNIALFVLISVARSENRVLSARLDILEEWQEKIREKG